MAEEVVEEFLRLRRRNWAEEELKRDCQSSVDQFLKIPSDVAVSLFEIVNERGGPRGVQTRPSSSVVHTFNWWSVVKAQPIGEGSQRHLLSSSSCCKVVREIPHTLIAPAPRSGSTNNPRTFFFSFSSHERKNEPLFYVKLGGLFEKITT